MNNAWLDEQCKLIPTNTMPSEPSTREEEVQWMREVASGNDVALTHIIRRWQKPLINFFYRSTQSVELAEDLAQMTFIKLYRAAPNYEPTAKFSTFLFHIGRHLLINEIRRQSRKPLDTIDPNDLVSITPGRDKLELMEIEEAFSLALSTLPENHKTAILLLKQQGLSYEEIAATMGASESAVKSWIHRARTKLKEELKDFYER